jgi:hypothetical protein
MYFMPRRVWTEPDGEVRVVIRNETHRVTSRLRLVHGRLEPIGELHTQNLATGETHAWTPMPFPGQK